MKKKGWIRAVCLTACMTLVFLALAGAACAEGSKLPTIDQALKSSPEEKVRVSGMPDNFYPLNPNIEDYGKLNYKILILQRVRPLKELEERRFDAPIEGSVEYSADYEGTDIGEEKVYVRGDLMKMLPSKLRAKSLADAGILLVAENLYLCSGTLTITSYKNSGGDDLPEFETVEEMAEYLENHQPEVDYMSCYPKFMLVNLVSLYDAKTGNCDIYSNEQIDASLKARNPEASLQAQKMDLVLNMMIMLTQDTVDKNAVKAEIDQNTVFPEESRTEWSSLVDEGKLDEAFDAMAALYWGMAEELKEMDTDPENRKNYELIIEARNYAAMRMYISHCSYSSFAESIDTVREEKLYIPELTDMSWYEAPLKELIDVFKSIV